MKYLLLNLNLVDNFFKINTITNRYFATFFEERGGCMVKHLWQIWHIQKGYNINIALKVRNSLTFFERKKKLKIQVSVVYF